MDFKIFADTLLVVKNCFLAFLCMKQDLKALDYLEKG